MLLQFKVKNYKSIRNELNFNTVAKEFDPADLLHQRHFLPQAAATKDLNSVSFIYGSNASGKSNFVKAIGTMKSIILESSRTTEGDTLPYEPHLFSDLTKNSDTEFEMEFVANHVRYQYGFSYNVDQVNEEWLFAYPKGKPQKWLMRHFDEDSNEYIYERCDNLSGHKKLLESATRNNALFLSTAVQLKNEQLQDVFSWFKDTLRVVGSSGPSNSFSIDKMTGDSENTKNAIVRFMKAADFSINNFVIEELELEKELDILPKELQNLIRNSNQKPKMIEIKSGHLNDKGETCFLDINDESDGTQKLFELAGPWLDTFENSRVLIMDEINLHLHPKLSSFLVKLFYNKELNNAGSQLITTTHETNLLKEDVSKRDQIWVMDRYKDGSSSLNNLAKYSPRLELNLEKAFLQGKFEGVPVTNVAEVIRARSDYHG